jgi:hypothetical protein
MPVLPTLQVCLPLPAKMGAVQHMAHPNISLLFPRLIPYFDEIQGTISVGFDVSSCLLVSF